MTTAHEFTGASWISRAVPASQRIVREIRRDRIDWAEPGHSLAQQFRAHGGVHVVSLDIAGPRDSDAPNDVDVRFTVSLVDQAGTVVAQTVVEGPHLVWDWFDIMLEVSPPAPPGDYTVQLRAERETIGWWTADDAPVAADDGVSPTPVIGVALADGAIVDGIRLIGVDTTPAPNPLFRRRFALDDVPREATLHATVLGTGVVFVNGTRIGRGALEPAVTDWDKTVLFRSEEVAHLLRRGENEIRIDAGRERYAARGGDVWGWNLAPWHREPTALVRLDIDGTNALVSDQSWEAAPGPVEVERFFLGEQWVLREHEPTWAPAQVVDGPSGQLRPAELPPIEAQAPRPPVVTEQLSATSTVYDFGQVMVGRVRFRVTAGPGTAIEVISGEQRGDHGHVICDNRLVAGHAQTDSLRIDRDVDGYVFEPQFGYRGFRWIQITVTGDATVDQVRAVPLYTELDEMGELSASDPLLEWINTATGRTFRNNLHGIPTDTPIYERNGWTADAHLATESLLHHFDLRAPFGKWMQDHRDSQTNDGSIPHVVPTPGWGRDSDPTWSSSAVLIPWYLYREYGDLAILQDNADMIRRFADHVLKQLGAGLWRHRTWGDWLAPGYHVPPEGMPPIGTIMCVTVFQHTADVLRALGDPDADSWDRAAEEVGRRYHDAYFDARSGSYSVEGVGFRQSLAILPLAFGVVPAEHVHGVRASLISDIENRTEGHLDCGAVGVRHLLDVLSDAGRDDLAITLLTKRTRPSWGAWFDAGESTLLESWDVNARSRNHYFLGSVSSWIQQRVGGLKLTEPGWRSFDINPVDDDRVSAATIRHRTPEGVIDLAWQHGAGGWLLRVEVPVGTKARLRLGGEDRIISAGRHTIRVQ